MDRLIEARRWDIYRDPFEDQAAMDAYLEDTGGGLMWLAARALGAGERAEQAARDLGWASGLASFLRAVPDLEARGRIPLLDGRPDAVAALAERGLARLAQARTARHLLPPAATLAAWQAGPVLHQAARDPVRVATGTLGLSEFSRRARLLLASVTGRV
jgi:phytoene/squalene synthetase